MSYPVKPTVRDMVLGAVLDRDGTFWPYFKKTARALAGPSTFEVVSVVDQDLSSQGFGFLHLRDWDWEMQ